MDKTFRYRLRILAVIALSMFAALTARLWFLQVLSGEEAAAVPETNIHREIRVPALRGKILDMEGDRIKSWKGYQASGKGYVICQRTLPLNLKNLEQRLFEEFNRLRQLEASVEKVLLSI